MANPMANPVAGARKKRAPPVVARTERRRQFSEDAKRRILGEASRPRVLLRDLTRQVRMLQPGKPAHAGRIDRERDHRTYKAAQA